MKSYSLVDRFFHSVKELIDIRESEERDINTLFSFLENLHAIRDKLKKQFNVDIAKYPEFKFLRILRNYFHHVDDIDEIRMFRNLESNIQFCHLEQIIIHVSVVAKSIKLFKENNANGKNKIKFAKKEIDSILNVIDAFELLDQPELFTDTPTLKCDGKVVELGFDIFKFIYNISNIIADECRTIQVLSEKSIITEIEEEYSVANNIPKLDMMSSFEVNVVLTTKGHIFPKTIERAI